MEAKIYNTKGKESGNITLPDSIFNIPWNGDLVHQVITSMAMNMRKNVAHTKNRSDVSGGGKKPWKQKGTGRARHGSTRSPIWVGGGVAHGPRNEKNFDRKVNKSMRNKALAVILSKKNKDGEIIFVDSISFSEPKTKEAVAIQESLAKNFKALNKPKNAGLFILSSRDNSVVKSFRNIPNVSTSTAGDIDPVTSLSFKYLVIVSPEESIKALVSRITREKVNTVEDKKENKVVNTKKEKSVKAKKTTKKVASKAIKGDK